MGDNLVIALLITAIGMGLVFGAILLLWGVMALLMRLTVDRTAEAEDKAEEDTAEADELELKQRAAAVAVTLALAAEEESQPHEFPLPPTAVVSPWQAVLRTNMINKRGPVR